MHRIQEPQALPVVIQRRRSIPYEAFAARIAKDIFDTIKPKSVTVTVTQKASRRHHNLRGGEIAGDKLNKIARKTSK